MPFTTLGINSELNLAISKLGYEKPYPIQLEAIPHILKGKDLMGIAKTGSGKTASYALPILQNLKNAKPLSNRHVGCLVIVPTRELAVQVSGVFKNLYQDLPYPCKTLAIYGGVSINTQMQKMQNVQILVATPGRLLDLIDNNAVHLSEVRTLVLDEADKLLNFGFKQEMDEILNLLPKKRQNLLFSATLGKGVKEITSILLNNPEVVKIESQETEIETINQKAYAVSEERKGPLLRYLIKSNDYNQILIFTASSYKADSVSAKLNKNGIEAMSIHGKKSQGARTTAINKFKSGKLKVLVSTDLLARGIDIEYLPCVINYELPRSPKDYIHRIGRTGRAENSGDAISIITPEETHHFRVIQKKMKKRVEMILTEDLDLSKF